MCDMDDMDDIVIEPATPSDLPELVRLEEACFSSPWTSKMLEAELSGNRFARFLVARRMDMAGGSAIIAYLCFWIVFEEVRIMNLAVLESMRRRGIGRTLADLALQAGREEGAVRALLEVRYSNLGARALYERLGFRQTTIRPRYYTNPEEDAVLMEMYPIVTGASRSQNVGAPEGGVVQSS